MKFSKYVAAIAMVALFLFFACKDKTTDPAPSGCDSKNIQVAGTLTQASKCISNGKITVKASGSTGFTYQLNSGSFQPDSVFSNLAAGTYNITAKDKDGCTKTSTFTVTENGTNGPTFTAVAALIASKCEGGFCHGTGAGGAPKNIMNTDCKITNLGPTIKTKAVDEGMGSLSTTDKNKITAWITAGGRTTD